MPIKQAVIAASALSLLYPQDEEIAGYSQQQFLTDLVGEARTDIARCLEAGAHTTHSTEVDYTELLPSLFQLNVGSFFRDRVLEAAEFIDPRQLGTCDDCGFSPFGDDTSTARKVAFDKICARVEGTRMPATELGLDA